MVISTSRSPGTKKAERTYSGSSMLITWKGLLARWLAHTSKATRLTLP